MKYEIIGGNMPVVNCTLDAQENIITESGGMCWMDDCFDMNTNTNGGLLKGLGRAFAGDSIFMTTYTCHKPGGKIAFASSFPGKILPIQLNGGALIAQKRAFLAGETTVDISTHFTKKLGAGFFGGEGFILQKLSGYGTAFLEIDGDLLERTLAPGEVLKVDQGYIAAFEESVKFDITTVKGMKNILFSGEGLFVATLTGPGRVYLQTMPFSTLANQIIARIPSKG